MFEAGKLRSVESLNAAGWSLQEAEVRWVVERSWTIVAGSWGRSSRWMQLVGRVVECSWSIVAGSPHASGKAKNTFGHVGIRLLGAPHAPGNKPTPSKGKKAWEDGPLRPEEISSAEAHPTEPPRGKTAYRMQPNNWRRNVTNTLKKSGDLWIFRRRSLVHMKEWQHNFCRATQIESSSIKKWT